MRTRSISTLRENRRRIFLEIFGGHLKGDILASLGVKFRRVVVLGISTYRSVWFVSQ